jgi:hypothetical protein
MALDSISKLSVLITGDESPLARATQRASQHVEQFSRTVDTAYAKMVSKNLFKAVAGAGAHGVIKGMDAFFEVERRLDAVAVRFNKLRDEMGRFEIPAAGKMESVAKKWDLLWQNAADGFAVVASRMGPMLDWLNAKFDAKPAIQGMRALRAEADAQEKSMAALEDQWAKKQKRIADRAKEAADAIEDINNAHRAAFEQFQHRGEDLRKSLLTPIEAFRESMDEFNELLRLRMIDSETFSRAAAKARDELNETGRAKLTDQIQQPLAAAERYTMAGYSASLATQRDDKREEKQAVQLLGGIKDVMQHIDAQLGNRPDWPAFQMSRLN